MVAGDEKSQEKIFKVCTLCGKRWQTKDDFLGDAEVHLNGYQWNKKKLRSGEEMCGLLIFTHARESCYTTLGIEAKRFRVKAGGADKKSKETNRA